MSYTPAKRIPGFHPENRGSIPRGVTVYCENTSVAEKKNIKLVLFDIGGVLINYERAFRNTSIEQNIPL